jgi:hypothetical protein
MATLKIEERKKGAIKFVNKWKGRGREDEEGVAVGTDPES